MPLTEVIERGKLLTKDDLHNEKYWEWHIVHYTLIAVFGPENSNDELQAFKNDSCVISTPQKALQSISKF